MATSMLAAAGWSVGYPTLRAARRRDWDWPCLTPRQLPVGSALAFFLARPQIILGGAQPRPLRRAERVEVFLRRHLHATVGAHLHQIEPVLGVLEHPMFALELGRHALDRALHAKWRAAADAKEWIFLFDDAARRCRCAEIKLRRERDHLLRARRPAQPALHAGRFGKAQHRSLRIVSERAGRTSRNAGQTKRAAVD